MPEPKTQSAPLLYPSLDFPADRTVVTLQEIAEKWKTTSENVWRQRCRPNQRHLIEEGRLPVLNIGSAGVSRACLRVPVEAYRIAVLARLEGPSLVQMVAALPKPLLEEIYAECGRVLAGR